MCVHIGVHGGLVLSLSLRHVLLIKII